jgi:hypothetical protein
MPVELTGSRPIGPEYRVPTWNGDGERTDAVGIEPEDLARHAQPADRDVVVGHEGASPGRKFLTVDDAHIGAGGDETLGDVVT